MDKNTTTGKCLFLTNCVNNRNLPLYHLNIGKLSLEDLYKKIEDHTEKFEQLTENIENLERENINLKDQKQEPPRNSRS